LLPSLFIDAGDDDDDDNGGGDGDDHCNQVIITFNISPYYYATDLHRRGIIK